MGWGGVAPGLHGAQKQTNVSRIIDLFGHSSSSLQHNFHLSATDKAEQY